jgi:hypothetical protein
MVLYVNGLFTHKFPLRKPAPLKLSFEISIIFTITLTILYKRGKNYKREFYMKKCLILFVLLLSVSRFAFSQTGNSWNVTNTSTWIEAVNGIRSGGNDKTHTITVTGTISVPASTSSTFGDVTGITVTIEGKGTISPSANGALLNINAKQTVIAKDITLKGRSDNPSSVVDNMGGTFRMEGSASVTGNTRSGGIWVNGGTFIMQDSASVSGNSRSNGYNGGGVTVDNGGTFTMQSGTISGNTVNPSSNNNTSGGGVAVNNGTFTMNGGTISNNTVHQAQTNNENRRGGGVYNQGTFTMNGGTISGNSAFCGAGVYVDEDATFTMQGTIRSNSSFWGGGVYNRGTFTMNGTITRNTSSTYNASARGGGVYNSGTFTMQNGTITSNTANGINATAYGGGVYNLGTFTMQDGTISENTVSASGDTMGGGVYNNGTFTMLDGTISGTTAFYGGGVFINNGTFTMQGNASVSGNTAINGGGGVYVGNNDAYGTLTMKGNASVSGNTSGFNGGGVLVIGTGTLTMQDNTSISGNTATFHGGGVYVSALGTFNKTGGTIYGNDAEPNQRNTVISRFGNAVYGNANRSWRNVTAGPTMNHDVYGFWLNDGDLGDVVTFNSNYQGTWKRSNFNNTLTITSSFIKSSSSNYVWVFQRISGNSCTFKRADATNTITITVTLTGSNLVISGDSGSGQDNWNGTWYKQ